MNNHDDITASSSSSARARMDPDEARIVREEKARQKEIDAAHREARKREAVSAASGGTLRLPGEVAAALGDEPEREALEALLLHLIRTDRASVAWAGEKLGLDRQEAIRWYTSHGYPYPDYSEEDLEEDLRYAEDFGSSRRKHAAMEDAGDEGEGDA